MTDPDVQSLMSGSGLGPALKRYRPALIVGAVVLVLGTCLLAFRSHSQTYRVLLDESSPELAIQRGSFFFSGWGEGRKVGVGYDAGWQQRIGKPELIQELRAGKRFGSGPEVDAFIGAMFIQMGDRALEQDNPDRLLEAIYYFKQARKLYERTQPLPPEELPVRQKLVASLLRFADYHAGRGEKAQAKDTLEQARHYDPTNPEVPARLAKLEQPVLPTEVPQDSPKPAPKKPQKHGTR